MKNIALIVAGIIFIFITILHFVRYLKGWEVVLASHSIPLQWSIYMGLATGLLAIWMFFAAARG